MKQFANLITQPRKYINHDAYKIAKEKNTLIIEENLGHQIAGYSNNTNDKKLIHVNSKIPSYYKNIVIAYFLFKTPNICTQISGFDFLTIDKLAQLAQSCTA